MNAPLLALLTVLAAPLLAGWNGKAAAVLAILLAAAASLRGEGVAVAATALAEAAAAIWMLWTLRRLVGGPALGLLLWLAVALAPWWLPALAESLAAAERSLPGGWWSLWPGGLLASESWDPLREGPLYPAWGARTAVSEPSLWTHLAVLAGAGAILYWLRSMRPRDPEPAGESS